MRSHNRSLRPIFFVLFNHLRQLPVATAWFGPGTRPGMGVDEERAGTRARARKSWRQLGYAHSGGVAPTTTATQIPSEGGSYLHEG